MPCIPLRVSLRFGGTCPSIFRLCWPPAFTLVYCSAKSSTLKMEVTCFPKMLVDLRWIAWHYVPEDRTLHNHHCENLYPTCLIFFPQSLLLEFMHTGILQ
jgi:hypothetical protein